MAATEKKPRLGASKYRQRTKAIVALITSTSVIEASRNSGIAYSSLIRWMAEPDFKAELETVKRQYLSAAVGELQTTAAMAVRALRRVMELPHSSNMEIVAASRAILEFCDRFTVAENLETRISALEQQAGRTIDYGSTSFISETGTELRDTAESGQCTSVDDTDGNGDSSRDAGEPVTILRRSDDGPAFPGTWTRAFRTELDAKPEPAFQPSKVPLLIR